MDTFLEVAEINAAIGRLSKRVDRLSDVHDSDKHEVERSFERVDTALNAVKDVISADREDIRTTVNNDRTSADETFEAIVTAFEKMSDRVSKCEAELTCAYNVAMATSEVLERIVARLNKLEGK